MSIRVSFLVLMIASIAQTPHLLAQNSPGTNADYDERLEKGVDLYSQSKYAEAEVFFYNLTRFSSDRKEAYLWLGYVLSKQSKLPQAREAFQRYSELAPNDAEGLIAMARTYEAEDNKALAKLWYKKAQDRDPKSEQVRQALQQLENHDYATNAPRSNTSKQDGNKAPPDMGFWPVGLAGVTGARTVWWGRAIVLVVMVMSVVGGWSNVARLKERNPFMPAIVFFVSAGLGSAFWYVILWGIPMGWNWAWLGGFTVLNILATAGAMNVSPQPSRF